MLFYKYKGGMLDPELGREMFLWERILLPEGKYT